MKRVSVTDTVYVPPAVDVKGLGSVQAYQGCWDAAGWEAGGPAAAAAAEYRCLTFLLLSLTRFAAGAPPKLGTALLGMD